MQPILETKSLSFSYDGGGKALDSISLSIRAGKKCVFLGPNGSGKSTLFLHFNGVHRPDSGKIFFEGNELDYSSASLSSLRSSVSLVFQNPDDQIFSATVEEDVAFGPLNSGLPREEIMRRVDDTLSLVGLEDLRERPTQQLSFGQRKRVSIAGALAMKPKVLLMDEPTAGLDPEMVHELLELSEELNHKGVTVAISTHDIETAYEWADEVMVLHSGKLAFSGHPDDFFSKGNIHDFGFSPPMAFLLNQQMHWRTGRPELPRPRSFSELAAKSFPQQNKKCGTMNLACIPKDAGAFSKPAKHAETKPHLLTGIYGSRARRLASEGKLDAHYRFHAIEHGLLQASLGNDFTLFVDSELCPIVERKARLLEERSGLRVQILHSHPSQEGIFKIGKREG